jgi:DNA ligase-1
MKPMLAGKADLAKLQYPVLASPKLDGVRALVIGGVVYSRNMKPIPSRQVQALYGKKSLNNLDGELIVGNPCSPDCFRRTVSTVMADAQTVDSINFFVFDNFSTPDAPFHHRKELMVRKEASTVEQTFVSNEKELRAYEVKCLSEGFEGVMLRSIDGPYKQGRSTTREGYLLKLKRFEDGEAVVIGFEEEMHNTNAKVDGKRTSHKAGKIGKGTLGAIVVRDIATRQVFNIGTGFTADERENWWKAKASLLGRLAHYRYFPTGGKDAPRFPTFAGWRDDL